MPPFYSDLSVDQLTAMIARHPDDGELRLTACQFYVRRGDFESALAQSQTALEILPGSPRAEALQAMCMLSTNKIFDGNELLQSVFRRYPCEEFQAWVTKDLASLFNYEGRARNQWPPQTPSHEATGKEYFAFNKIATLFSAEPDQCIAGIEEYLLQNPEDFNALMFLGKGFRFRGRKQEAEPLFRKVLLKYPDAAAAMFELASVVSNPWEAIELLRSGLEICNFDQRAKCQLATFFIQVGKYEHAFEAIGNVPADSSFYGDSLLLQARSLELLKRYDDALARIELAVRLKPECANYRGKYGQMLSDLARFDESLEQLKLAAELDPTQYLHWANIGLSMQYLSRTEEAISAFKNALAINPNCVHIAGCLKELLANRTN